MDKNVKDFWEMIRRYKDIVFDMWDENGRWGITEVKNNSKVYNFMKFVFPEFEIFPKFQF